jgi:hypothetical protein
MNLVWELLKGRLLGDPPGVQRRLIHSWPWPHWLTLVVLLAAASFILAVYLRERGRLQRATRALLVLLRLAQVTLILVVMMYGWQVITDVTDLPDLVVYLDDSRSMRHSDAYEDSQVKKRLQQAGWQQSTRWNHARAVLLAGKDEGLLAQLQRRYHVKLYRVAGSVRLQPGDQDPQLIRQWEIDDQNAAHSTSRLGIGLRGILEAQRGRPTAAVVLLTDGITTEGKTISEIAAYARRMDIPLYVVGIGDDRPGRDVWVSDVLADDVVFVGDLAHVDFRLHAGGVDSQSVNLQLRRAGSSEVLAERNVTVTGDGNPLPLRLSFRPEEVGDWEVEVIADAGEQDINPGNNRVTRTIRVRDDVMRVLYVQDHPSFEFRYLKSLLERGRQRGGEGRKAVELQVVLQAADLEFSAIDASAERTFPVAREELFQFDVILFGDTNPAFFSTSLFNNLADFVRVRGGGLVFLCGPEHTPWDFRGTPLAEIMPIDPDTARPPRAEDLLHSEYNAVPTDVGLTSPLVQLSADPGGTSTLWRQFPALRWVAEAPDLRPGARVQPLPLVTMQFVGAGKVVMVLTDETHRWARHPDGEVHSDRFWLQTIRYLSRTKLLGANRLVELATDKESYERGEPIGLKVRFLDDRLAPPADDGVAVVLEQEGGRRRSVTLVRDAAHRGVFRALVTQLPEGEYRAWMATPVLDGPPAALRFPVVAPQSELARLEMDATDLRRAAEVSRGRFYSLRDVEQLMSDLPAGRHVRVQTLPPQPLWNSSFWILLFLFLITGEWLLRKKAGML